MRPALPNASFALPTAPRTPKPGECLKPLRRREREPSRAGRLDDWCRQGVLAALIETGRKGEDYILCASLHRDDPIKSRLTVRERAGFIDDQSIHAQ